MRIESTDWTEVFPILGTTTYLASHTQGAVPDATAGALAEYHEVWKTQGVKAWDGPWWSEVTSFCSTMERLLGAEQGTVAPMQNATRAMAAVASCFDYSKGRDKIVMTDLEFTTFYPLWGAQQRLGARLEIVTSDDGVTVPVERLIEAVDDETSLVATCHAYFRSGAMQDLKSLSRAAHDEGAVVLGDGYQVVGSVPVDVQDLDVDFYVGGAHKYLCGGAGAGYLYVRPDRIQELKPRLTGWFGMKNPFAFVADTEGRELNEGVFRFLDGTPNVPALYSAREGLRIVAEVGPEAIRRHSLSLTSAIVKRAAEDGLEVRSPLNGKDRSGMVCLGFPGAQETAERLVGESIVVDWRPDCGLRAAPHFYSRPHDIDILLDGIAKHSGTTVPGAAS